MADIREQVQEERGEGGSLLWLELSRQSICGGWKEEGGEHPSASVCVQADKKDDGRRNLGIGMLPAGPCPAYDGRMCDVVIPRYADSASSSLTAIRSV